MLRAIAVVVALFAASSAMAQQNVLPFVTTGGNPVTVAPVGFPPGVPLPVTIAPSSSVTVGITPVVSASAEATHVLKSAPGIVYSVYAANQTGTAGFLVVLNMASSPSDGAITPLACVALPANGNTSVNYIPGPAAIYSAGIVAVLTSGANCFTKTTGTITGFISGLVQ